MKTSCHRSDDDGNDRHRDVPDSTAGERGNERFTSIRRALTDLKTGEYAQDWPTERHHDEHRHHEYPGRYCRTGVASIAIDEETSAERPGKSESGTDECKNPDVVFDLDHVSLISDDLGNRPIRRLWFYGSSLRSIERFITRFSCRARTPRAEYK